jgi:hypothetical protein
MSEPEKAEKPASELTERIGLYPKCGFCEAEPVALRRRDANIPGGVAGAPAVIGAILFCGGCHAVLGVVALGVVAGNPAPQKRIVGASRIPPNLVPPKAS